MDKKIIAIDDNVKATTKKEIRDNALKVLYDSANNGTMLRGVVSGVERISNMPVAVTYYKGFKIIVPAVEFMDFTIKPGQKPDQLMHYLLRKRLGSEFDFIIKAVNEDTDIAIASRKEALNIKKDKYFFNKDENGEFLISEGDIIETRVVAVMQSGIIVECFGLEVYIPPKELAYQRIHDSADLFSVGDRVLMKIISLSRDLDKKDINIAGSIKLAYNNPVGDIIKRFNIGDIYTGKVSMIDGLNVFVMLDGGIDVLCKYPDYGMKPIVGSVVSVRITLKNEEMNRVFGVITNMARL